MKRSPSSLRSPERRRAERAGRRAEDLAGLYLRLKGYRPVARRFKTPLGEIDLIVCRGRMVIFVEVKERSGANRLEMALGAVNRGRITRAAQWFLARNGRYDGFDCRFDVVVVAPWRMPFHLMNAFPPA